MTARDVDRLLTIQCRAHGNDCLQIECRIIELLPPRHPDHNTRHAALLNRLLNHTGEDPWLIYETGRAALKAGDSGTYMQAMHHLEDLGFAYWSKTDWNLNLPERTYTDGDYSFRVTPPDRTTNRRRES